MCCLRCPSRSFDQKIHEYASQFDILYQVLLGVRPDSTNIPSLGQLQPASVGRFVALLSAASLHQHSLQHGRMGQAASGRVCKRSLQALRQARYGARKACVQTMGKQSRCPAECAQLEHWCARPSVHGCIYAWLHEALIVPLFQSEWGTRDRAAAHQRMTWHLCNTFRRTYRCSAV